MSKFNNIDDAYEERDAVPMKPLHLRGRKVNEVVLRKGRTWKGKMMTIRWIAGAPRGHTAQGLYVGTLASAKLDKSAVRRNRMRRRCREALRIALQNRATISTAQLLLCPRNGSLHAPFQELEADIQAFLSTLR